ncbi:MAG TPA: cytochrome c [Myxococcaceae bacterium]|nr:cytochrome c [Myxococcaceae bacterium]
MDANRHRRAPLLLFLAVSAPAVAVAQGAPPAPAASPGAPQPLSGPSLLRALALSVDASPLGRLGGDGPPRSTLPQAFIDSVRKALTQAGVRDEAALQSLRATFPVSGADIYRLNCRSCHGPAGAGKPPAIASIIGPARALSPAQHEAVMKAAGSEPNPELARQLALHAEALLRERLAKGGVTPKLPYLETMPPFAFLSEQEVLALADYLKQLAGVAGKGTAVQKVNQSAMRIGEQLVRGTCRICHDATGMSGGHALMMAGLVPALGNLPEQMSLDGVVHKVRHGWTSMAGMARPASRMPIFAYLSDEEVAAAYLYLAYLPPQQVR